MITFTINLYHKLGYEINIKFVDSLKKIPKPLRDLPKMFGLESYKENYPYDGVNEDNFHSDVSIDSMMPFLKCSKEEFI